VLYPIHIALHPVRRADSKIALVIILMLINLRYRLDAFTLLREIPARS